MAQPPEGFMRLKKADRHIWGMGMLHSSHPSLSQELLMKTGAELLFLCVYWKQTNKQKQHKGKKPANWNKQGLNISNKKELIWILYHADNLPSWVYISAFCFGTLKKKKTNHEEEKKKKKKNHQKKKKWKPDTESEQSFAEYRQQIAG